MASKTLRSEAKVFVPSPVSSPLRGPAADPTFNDIKKNIEDAAAAARARASLCSTAASSPDLDDANDAAAQSPWGSPYMGFDIMGGPAMMGCADMDFALPEAEFQLVETEEDSTAPADQFKFDGTHELYKSVAGLLQSHAPDEGQSTHASSTPPAGTPPSADEAMDAATPPGLGMPPGLSEEMPLGQKLVKVVRDEQGSAGYDFQSCSLTIMNIAEGRESGLHPMQVGDVILAVNGTPVTVSSEYHALAGGVKEFTLTLTKMEDPVVFPDMGPLPPGLEEHAVNVTIEKVMNSRQCSPKLGPCQEPLSIRLGSDGFASLEEAAEGCDFTTGAFAPGASEGVSSEGTGLADFSADLFAAFGMCPPVLGEDACRQRSYTDFSMNPGAQEFAPYTWPVAGTTLSTEQTDADIESAPRLRASSDLNPKAKVFEPSTAKPRATVSYTTAMLRNIPNKYTREMLVKRMDEAGFKGLYDFLYLPIDFKNKCNVGYCFINFRQATACAKFVADFHEACAKTKLPGFNSSKICEVSPARVQGCDANVRRLQTSPLMTELIGKPEWLPSLFDTAGNMIDFPVPDDVSQAFKSGKTTGSTSERPAAAAREGPKAVGASGRSRRRASAAAGTQ